MIAGIAAPPADRRMFYGWKLLAIFWLILVANLAFPMTGAGLLMTAMAATLHLSRTELGLPFSAYFGVIGLASPLVAWLIGRIGVRWMLVVGNLALLIGAVAMATIVTSSLGAVVWFGGVVGFGVAAGGNLTTQTAIPRWFVRRRALAFAILLTATAAGGMVVAPTIAGLLKASAEGWRHGWWLMAAFALGAMILAALFVRERPADVGQLPDGRTDVAGSIGVVTAAPPPPAGLLLRRADFWTILIGSAVITAAISLVIAHGVANALDAGYSAAQVGWAVALYAFAGFAGKAIIGTLGDRFNPAFIWAGLLVPGAVGLLVAAFGMRGDGLYLYAFAAGCGLNGTLVCQPATVAHRFGAGGFARVAGFTFLFQAIAGVCVPTLAGWLFTPASGYRWSFAAVAAACLAAALLLCITCRDGNRYASDR